jgi:hypothetical protein
LGRGGGGGGGAVFSLNFFNGNAKNNYF